MPQIGDTVHVWPHPGRNVRSHAELNRFLPEEGMKLPWSAWLEEQLGQGMVHLTEPKAQIDAEEAKKRIAASVAAEEAAAKEAAATPAPTPTTEAPAAPAVASEPTSAPNQNEGK